MNLFQGIIVNARGPHTFGWDPIFQPTGFTQTYAEMDSETKNEISHRKKAVKSLQEFFMSSINKEDDLLPQEKRPKVDSET